MPFERVVARRAEAVSDEASHDTHPSGEQEQRLHAKIQRFFHESFTAFSEGEAKRLEWNRAHPYAYGEIHADHPEEIRDHLELIQEIVEAYPEDDGGQRLAIKASQAAIVAQELLAWVTSYEVPPIEKANLIRYVRTWEHLLNFGASLRAGDVSSSVPMFARFNVIPGMASIFEHQQKELRDTILANKDEVSQLFRSCEREEMIRLAALFADIGQYATQHSYGWYARNQAEDRGKTEQFNQLIRTWAKSAESPPLIKYLCLAELKKDVPSYEASRNETMNLWRTIDGNGSEVGIDVRHIARDALAIVDVNDAILQVAEYEHANQPAEKAPPSYYLRAILDWYEQKKIDALGTFDAYDIFEEYEKNIKPYLSAVERDRFEELWGTADAEVRVTALLHEWLEKGPYQKVAFESPEVVMNDMGYRGHLSSDTVSLVMSQMHREGVREDIERDLGCDLASFSLREQAQLLSLMTYGDKKRYRELTHLTRRYGKSAGICLFACEQRPALAEKIITLAQGANRALAQEVFDVCAHYLVNAQKDASALAREIFHGSAFGVNQRLVEDVLIERAIGVIEEAAERVGGDNAANDIRRRLERATPEMVVLAAITKTALKGREQDVNIARIRDVSVHAQCVGDMPPAEREKRFAVYKKILEDNWQKKGQQAAAQALHGLEEGFSRSDTEFFELQIAGKPVAFMRFDQRPDLGSHDLYGGSFNVIPELAGSALGSVFLHETLREKGKDHRLHVHVLATDRLASVYVEEFGFTITGLEREPSATGESVSWFKIERAPKGEKPVTDASSLYIGSRADMSGALDWVEDVTNNAVITSYIIDKTSDRLQMKAVPRISQRQEAA